MSFGVNYAQSDELLTQSLRRTKKKYKWIIKMNRPEFENIKDFAEFSKYYWYRDELIKICMEHGLKAPSGKIELNKVIEAYFSGEKILPDKKPVSRKKKIIVIVEHIIYVLRKFHQLF